MISIRKNSRGIGLLELMLSMAIIATLLVMATNYFIAVSRRRAVMEAVDNIQALRSAGERWVTVNNSLPEGNLIKKFLERNYIPVKLTKSPWGPGDVTCAGIVIPGQTGRKMQITMTGMKSSECQALKSEMLNISSTYEDCSICSDSTPKYCGSFAVGMDNVHNLLTRMFRQFSFY